MKASLPEGKYIVAVSGGVDSVVLLDALARQNDGSVLVVAHYDHGIRPDSADDAAFVKGLADAYGLQYYTERGELGAGASEAVARRARYAFLHRVQAETGADAIVTAHHQDDVLETMLLNLIRGTKWRGLHSLRSTNTLQRPLLSYSKQAIMQYARDHQLVWHEDTTNGDLTILRNYLRHAYLPRMDAAQRAALLDIRRRAQTISTEIDAVVSGYLQTCPTGRIWRADFRVFSDDVACELLAAWLHRDAKSVEVTTALLTRLVAAIRHGRNGSWVDVKHGLSLTISRHEAVLVSRAKL